MRFGHMNTYKVLFNMILARLNKMVAVAVLLMSSSIYAVDGEEQHGYLPTSSLHASWVFSGVVMNETGDHYGYFFQMERREHEFHVLTALFDGQNNAIIVKEESSAVLSEPVPYNWHVGRAFLRFNPINDSWIFGVKNPDKKGFNFKVDMIKEPENRPVNQSLRPGVDFLISRTGQLNGHIQIDEHAEQFVTAKNAWFRQVWITNNQAMNQSYSGVLCGFNDWSGFYSVNTVEAVRASGAESGWFDAKGISTLMSQFIKVKQSPDDGPWHIHVLSPNMHLILSEYLQQDSAIAGFVAEGKTSGFCLLSKNAWKDKPTSVIASVAQGAIKTAVNSKPASLRGT